MPFEGRKVEGSRKYSRRERVLKVRSRGEETITEPKSRFVLNFSCVTQRNTYSNSLTNTDSLYYGGKEAKTK